MGRLFIAAFLAVYVLCGLMPSSLAQRIPINGDLQNPSISQKVEKRFPNQDELTLPACVPEATKTVFVTVYNPGSSLDDSSTAGISQTPFPVTTILISPLKSSAKVRSTVKQFTTLTVSDLWPQITSSGKSSSVDGIIDSTKDATMYTSESSVQKTAVPSSVVVTDTNVQWSSHSTGMVLVTVLSTHTITYSSVKTVSLASTLTNSEKAPSSTFKMVESDGSISMMPLPTVTSSDSGSPTTSAVLTTVCETFTIPGSDGNPTVITQTQTFLLNNPAPVLSGLSDFSSSFASGLVVSGISESSIFPPDPNTPLWSSVDHFTTSSVDMAVMTPPSYNGRASQSSQIDVWTPLPPHLGKPSGIGSGIFTVSQATISVKPSAYATSDSSSHSLLPVTDTLLPYTQITSGGGSWASSVLYGSVPTILSPTLATPSMQNTTILQTKTWTNLIPEPTTTYTMKFPLTTLVTVTNSPSFPLRARAIRRQDTIESDPSWDNSTAFITRTLSVNTSSVDSITPPLESPTPISTPILTPISTLVSTPISVPISIPTPINSTVLSSVSPSPSQLTPSNTVVEPAPTSTICIGGAKVGNTTVNFDSTPPGPLLNPASDLWFSEGFLIAPPSSPRSDPYVPSSGGNLVEFVPPALSFTSLPLGAGDTAEIGVGPNFNNPCFRFNLYSANLGCAAEGVEKWCEFEVSAYSNEPFSATETSKLWSETKRIPACPTFASGSCSLTPIEFEGYSNITSVLIRVRVGLELRAWWGDDFKFGWTSNDCDSSACRSNAARNKVKREVVHETLRRGVWQWGPYGLKRLDNDYIYAAVSE